MSQSPFSPTSRYAAIEIAQWTDPTGRTHAFVRRRFVPNPDDLQQVGRHVVVAGDRLDTITAAAYGDPGRWWQVADGNRALRPDDLLTPLGRPLRLTLPEGVVGVTLA